MQASSNPFGLPSNNAINTDGQEQCSFVALLMAAGYGERWSAEDVTRILKHWIQIYDSQRW